MFLIAVGRRTSASWPDDMPRFWIRKMKLAFAKTGAAMLYGAIDSGLQGLEECLPVPAR